MLLSFHKYLFRYNALISSSAFIFYQESALLLHSTQLKLSLQYSVSVENMFFKYGGFNIAWLIVVYSLLQGECLNKS